MYLWYNFFSGDWQVGTGNDFLLDIESNAAKVRYLDSIIIKLLSKKVHRTAIINFFIGKGIPHPAPILKCNFVMWCFPRNDGWFNIYYMSSILCLKNHIFQGLLHCCTICCRDVLSQGLPLVHKWIRVWIVFFFW